MRHCCTVHTGFIWMQMLAIAYAPLAVGQPPIEQVVVTGTRTEKRITDSPVAIDIISASEISTIASSTLADVLEYIPGIAIQPSEKSGYNIMMQGFDGDRVLVLLDGLRVTSPTGEAADLAQISALDIERIEVMRGAGSVLYGSAAMGGVVNIITKTPVESGLRLQAEVGSYTQNALKDSHQPFKLNTNANYQGSRWQARLLLQHEDDPGFDYDPDNLPQSAGSVKNTFIRGGVSSQTGPVSVRYTPQYLSEEKLRATSLLPGGLIGYYLSEVTQYQHDLGLYSDAGWQVQLRASDHKEPSGESAGLRNAHITNVDLDSQYIFNTTSTEWVTGLRYFEQTIRQIKNEGTVELDNVKRNGTEVFAQTDWTINPQLEVVVGARAQHDSDFGKHHALRFNALLQPDIFNQLDFKWRLSVGEGYRVPSLKERHYIFDHSNLGYTIEGNLNLKPETSVSANSEFSFTWPRKAGAFVLDINTHYSEANDFIEPAQISNSNGLLEYQYQNREAVRMQGVDLAFSFSGERPWQIHYSYLDARDRNTAERLPERPRHQLKANYWYQFEHIPVEIVLFAAYQKDEYSTLMVIKDEALSLNTRVQWQLTDYLQLKFGADNIFDSHVDESINEKTEFDLRPVRSRYVFTNIQLNF